MLRLILAALTVVVLWGSATVQPDSKVPKDLAQYVAKAKGLGATDEQIREGAVKAGWSESAVKDAIALSQPAENASPAVSAKGTDVIPAASRLMAANGIPATVPRNGVPDDYRIGEGDVISVSVWREADASVPSAVVRPDGKVSLPLIKEMYISGMTPSEAEKAVTQQLSAFINKPDVAVVVREIHSKRVYVVGAARKEGPLAYTYRMTVMQAISEAGGLTDYAKRKKIYILRTQNGKQQKLPFSFDAALKGEHMERNIELQPGDTLVIPN